MMNFVSKDQLQILIILGRYSSVIYKKFLTFLYQT